MKLINAYRNPKKWLRKCWIYLPVREFTLYYPNQNYCLYLEKTVKVCDYVFFKKIVVSVKVILKEFEALLDGNSAKGIYFKNLARIDDKVDMVVGSKKVEIENKMEIVIPGILVLSSVF